MVRSATKLVELRQPETLRTLDDHHRSLRHVDSYLDHRRGEQDLNRSVSEARNGALPLLAAVAEQVASGALVLEIAADED